MGLPSRIFHAARKAHLAFVGAYFFTAFGEDERGLTIDGSEEHQNGGPSPRPLDPLAFERG